MKKSFLTSLILCLIFLISCSNNSNPTAKSPSVESPSVPAAAKSPAAENPAASAAIDKSKVDACVDAWIDDFRKENGEDAVIRVDMLEEATQLCEKKQSQAQQQPAAPVASKDISTDYETFFKKFEADKSYQASHIKFPYQYASEGPDGSTNEEIQKSKYKYFGLFKEKVKNEYTKINDNEFKVEKRGVESGVAVDYYFKKFENEWYLVKIVDYSA